MKVVSCYKEGEVWFKKAAVIGQSKERLICLDLQDKKISWYNIESKSFIGSLDFSKIKKEKITLKKPKSGLIKVDETQVYIPMKVLERGRLNLIIFCKGDCVKKAEIFKNNLLNAIDGKLKQAERQAEAEITSSLSVDEKFKKLREDFYLNILSRFSPQLIPNNLGAAKVVELNLDRETPGIDGGAYGNNIEITIEALNLSPIFRKFAILHEMGHIVTIPQANLYQFGYEITDGTQYNSYIKSEFLADLMAIHHMTTSERNEIIRNKKALINLLDHADAMHPSGSVRVEKIESYIIAIAGLDEASKEEIFHNFFSVLWAL